MPGRQWLGGLVVGAVLSVGLSADAMADQSVERGRYLIEHRRLRQLPHAAGTGWAAGRHLAGGLVIEEGIHAQTPNITPDVETGIGGWTDPQIIRAIREGKRPDGTMIGPPMPDRALPRHLRRDVEAIVAYLRPCRRWSTSRAPATPSRCRRATATGRIGGRGRARRSGCLRRLSGRAAGHCIECHTPLSANPGSGTSSTGWAPAASSSPAPGASRCRQHHPHRPRRLDRRGDRAITTGVRPDGEPLFPPMAFPYYANIDERDLQALIAYLRSLPPME